MSDEIYLNDNDVVFMAVGQNFAKTTTSKIGEIKEGMIRQCLGDSYSSWVRSGVNGQVLLEQGGGWQKGKIQLRLEFIPDEPEIPRRSSSIVSNNPQSPLDDLRSQLDAQ